MAREREVLVPQDLQELYRKAGWGLGRRRGFGDRPAVIAVDLQYAQVGDKPEPVLDSIVKYPMSAGAEGWAALQRVKELIDITRRCKAPLIFTAIKRDPFDVGKTKFPNKMPTARGPLPRVPEDLVEGFEPRPDEIMIVKKGSSAFHGTNLLRYLVGMQIDTLIIAGTTTGSCVRATAVDAGQNGFLPIIVEDCVFDRHPVRHAFHLFDMDNGPADVVPLREVKEYLERIASQRG